MDDLSPEHLALLRRMTPTQKMNALHSLYLTARALQKSRLQKNDASLSAEELEKQVSRYFLRATT
jgi:hypothetical protein